RPRRWPSSRWPSTCAGGTTRRSSVRPRASATTTASWPCDWCRPVASQAAAPRLGHGGSPSIQAPDFWWYQARSRLLEEALGPYVPAAGRVLDVGSADGPSAAWFRSRAASSVALDVDPRGLSGDGVCGSALALPFAD